MSSHSREEVLHRVRKGLSGIESKAVRKKTKAENFSHEAAEINKNLREIEDKLTGQFISEVENVNTTVIKAGSTEKLIQSTLKLSKEKQVNSFAMWNTPYLKELVLKERLKEEGLKVVTVKNKNRLAGAGIGITEVDYAIADTGTLVLLTDKDRPRGVSLLPPVHLAIVRPRNLVGNIKELFILLKDRLYITGEINSCITFITGPSRTADIELKLTLGVHGPKELFVLIS